MAPRQMQVGLHRSLRILAVSTVFLGTSTGARANEDGLGGLLQNLLSPEQQAQPAPAAPSAPQAASAEPQHASTLKQFYGRRSALHSEGMRLRPKIRYAALPKPRIDTVKMRVSERKVAPEARVQASDRQTALNLQAPLNLQVPLNMKDGPASVFLRDQTLRPGDIVVLKDGARVFTGSPDKPHAIKDFESIGRSDFIDRHTRTKVMAMLAPAGAVSLADARKQVEISKVLPTAVTSPVQVQASAVRVVYPWKAAP